MKRHGMHEYEISLTMKTENGTDEHAKEEATIDTFN